MSKKRKEEAVTACEHLSNINYIRQIISEDDQNNFSSKRIKSFNKTAEISIELIIKHFNN